MPRRAVRNVARTRSANATKPQRGVTNTQGARRSMAAWMHDAAASGVATQNGRSARIIAVSTNPGHASVTAIAAPREQARAPESVEIDRDERFRRAVRGCLAGAGQLGDGRDADEVPATAGKEMPHRRGRDCGETEDVDGQRFPVGRPLERRIDVPDPRGDHDEVDAAEIAEQASASARAWSGAPRSSRQTVVAGPSSAASAWRRSTRLAASARRQPRRARRRASASPMPDDAPTITAVRLPAPATIEVTAGAANAPLRPRNT